MCYFRHVGRSIAICNCPAGFTGGKCEVPVVNVTAGKWTDLLRYMLLLLLLLYYTIIIFYNFAFYVVRITPWTSWCTRNNSYDICLEFACVCMFFGSCKSVDNNIKYIVVMIILWLQYNTILCYIAVLSGNRITAFLVKIKIAAYPSYNI